MADVPPSRILLIIAILVSSINAQCTIDRARYPFSRAINEFSAEINSRIAQQTNEHFVASPLSLWSLISAVSEGADGSTLSEIQQALHHHPVKCFNWKYYDLIKQTKSVQTETLLERSGLLVIEENMNVTRKFVNSLKKLDIGDVFEISFSNPEYTANQVNEYIGRATHGAINEVVTPEEVADKFMLLLDAIHFKGKWKQSFDSAETEVSPFYNELNQQIGNVNMMFNSGTYNIIAVEAIKAKVLELQYGEDDKYSLLIFLPFEGETVQNVFDKLPEITIKSIFNVFASKSPRKLQVNIPRFKITSNVENLKELLNDMGITSMFDQSLASFGEICEFLVFVSDVIQKADIEVTEEGTSASAVSGSEFEERMMPEVFNANKPFAFMLVDKVTDVVLFSGAYSVPTLF